MAVPITASGKKGKGTLGTGSTPPVLAFMSKWTVDEERDDLDITVAEDNGFGNTEAGVKQCTINLEGYYFVGSSPLAPFTPTVPESGTGSTATDDLILDLKLYLYKSGTDVGPFWHFPAASVLKLSVGSEVRGKISFTAMCKSKGTFTRPAT